jgi:hypothetical protein
LESTRTTESKTTSNPVRRTEVAGPEFFGGRLNAERETAPEISLSAEPALAFAGARTGGYGAAAALQRRYGNAGVAAMARTFTPAIQRAT